MLGFSFFVKSGSQLLLTILQSEYI